jgi:uncharacterized membrane protein
MPSAPTPSPALQASRRFAIRPVALTRPLRWLALGWADLWRCPLPGLLHGAVTALFGALLLALARDRFWLLAGAFSGFLLVAPIVATGLYNVSRELQRGRQPTLRDALAVWKPNDGRLVVFGVLLAFAGTGWVMTSASLITGFAGAPVRNPAEFLRNVVAIPLLLDQRVGVLAAVLTSWRVVIENPAPMALWAGLLMALALLGMATLLVGLVLVVPWLAHASWHAYRDLIDGSAPDERA